MAYGLGWLGWVIFGRCFAYWIWFGLVGLGLGMVLGFVCLLIFDCIFGYDHGLVDEPESLILAQSERWRHA